jgi:hypoxanthine phosphoribosyltransferase
MIDYLDLTKNSYTKSAYAETTAELISNAEMQLFGQSIDFDSMVGIGNSGLLVLPILARHFNVPFFALRKKDSSHHNRANPFGDGFIGKRWILIDDVAVTGKTMIYAKQTIRKLTEANNFVAEYAGTYLYEPMTHLPGEFIYPDGKKNCVQAVTIDSHTQYVSFGVYAKVCEVWDRLYSPEVDVVGLVTEAVMKSYPSWDRDIVSFIAASLYTQRSTL